MTRRQLLKLIALGVAGHTLDIDRLLWVPGTKKIFIPDNLTRTTLTVLQIVELELQRIVPKVRTLFERDELFFRAIENKLPIVSSRNIRVPLELDTDFEDEC